MVFCYRTSSKLMCPLFLGLLIRNTANDLEYYTSLFLKSLGHCHHWKFVIACFFHYSAGSYLCLPEIIFHVYSSIHFSNSSFPLSQVVPRNSEPPSIHYAKNLSLKLSSPAFIFLYMGFCSMVKTL